MGHLILSLMVDARPGETWRRIWRALVTATLVLLGVAALAGAVWVLAQAAEHGWQTLDWERMQAAEILPLYSTFLLVFPPMYLMIQPLVPRRVQRALLDLLETPDTRWAALAKQQPEPFTGDELAQLNAGVVRLAPLRAIQGGYSTNGVSPLALMLGLLLMQSSLVLSEAARALGVEPPCCVFSPANPDLPFLFIFGGFGFFIIAFLAPAYIASLRRLRISADKSGLAWRQGGRWARQRRARWPDMCAFWRAPHGPLRAPSAVTYMLDTGSGVIGWSLGAASKDEEYTATEQLTRLIVTRAGLPLRDLGPLMVDLTHTKNSLKGLRAAALPDAIKVPLMVPRRRTRRVLWLIPLVLALMALLVGVPLLVDSRLEAAQQNYIAGLAPPVMAQTPLYRDTLIANDGQWPVDQPSTSNHQLRRAFVGDTYTLSGQAGQAVLAFGPAQYGDVAVAVTARQVPGSGDAGVGLVLRASADQSNMLAFYVSSADGTCTFAHYMTNPTHYNPFSPAHSNAAWEYEYGDASAAIHRGTGATNQVLVLARGSVFLLYVNGTLVASESSERYGPQQVLASGYAGVYLSDGATSGAYTNFAVYPVQSPPSSSYV